jgi:metallo-beta-lactamase class B
MEIARVLVAAALSIGAAEGARPFPADPPKACDSCAEWNAAREPFRVFGNTHYVGTGGLSAVLITSREGHILVDGGLPESAPLIDASIRALGFRTEDVKLIVNSHAHFDHAGGIAALQRASGAAVAASGPGARAIAAGEPTPDDPQYAFGKAVNGFPPAASVRAVADEETLRVGTLAITAHITPGHTPGSTTWTWRSCEGDTCADIVYADSLTLVSAPQFRFRDADGGRYVAAFRRGLAVLGGLPCDVLLTPHPSASGIDETRRPARGARTPFAHPDACRAYAANGARALERRLAEESAPALTPAP